MFCFVLESDFWGYVTCSGQERGQFQGYLVGVGGFKRFGVCGVISFF